MAGEEASTCEKSCLCHVGEHMACCNVSCGVRSVSLLGVFKVASLQVTQCSVDGSQYTMFDGQAFELHGSCNYTLVQTCLNKLDAKPVLIGAQGNHREGRQIYLEVDTFYFKTSTAFTAFNMIYC